MIFFENFRKTSLEYYKLDPANYLTSASLAGDAMMLKTSIELDLVSDVQILDMIEKSKRGGSTFIGSKRYAKANNKHMGDKFDRSKESSYIDYKDANSLYGYSMSQPLPYKYIKFETNINLETMLETSDDNETGYFVEADLEFSNELHIYFEQFPPCPETLTPDPNDYSDFKRS